MQNRLIYNRKNMTNKLSNYIYRGLHGEEITDLMPENIEMILLK